MSCLYILEINPLLFHLQIFSPILRVVFLSYVFLCCAKAFKFNYVPFVCFYFCYSRRWIKKDLAVIYVKECSSYVFL